VSPVALLKLLSIHDLHLAPVDQLGERARFQHHPTVSAMKWYLEDELVRWLDERDGELEWSLPDDPTSAMRSLGALGLVPPVYDWLAEEASMEELIAFLSLEGGPDGGFDDLVALCQVGLAGEPKLELARNYWDEMGRGSAAHVHTELHRQLTDALGLVSVPREDQPPEALLRSALGSLLATNRYLQPELVGALGMTELQAGPRCRRVVRALERLGAPTRAFAFYEEHAQADPRHGKAWVDHVVTPLAGDPEWGRRIVRGARWRALVNERFFSAMAEQLAPERLVSVDG
jgi:hypothetical protein